METSVRHLTSGDERTKLQASCFLLVRVYITFIDDSKLRHKTENIHAKSLKIVKNLVVPVQLANAYEGLWVNFSSTTSYSRK
jgi:hypothetical protein